MSKIITTKMFSERIKEKMGNDYEMISKYSGKYENITLKHKPCGYIYDRQAQVINNGGGKCPICNSKNSLYTQNEVQLKINRIIGNETYKVIKYTNKRTPIEIFHKDCGNNIELYLNNIIKGQRCQICDNKYNTSSYEEFKEKVEKLGNGEYELLSKEYINGKTKISMLHKNCGKKYKVTPHNFLAGTRCPKCRVSYNELKIENFLKENNINFIPQ
jgi:Zn ribbon nucleic-acid-binding protein